MQIKTSRKSGFTLVEIMIVVAIIGLLAAIAIPNFIKAREKSQTSVCISNLKQIDGAKEQYATEAHLTTGAAVTVGTVAAPGNLVPNYIKSAPQCPAGTTFYDGTVGAIGANPTCPNIVACPTHVLP